MKNKKKYTLRSVFIFSLILFFGGISFSQDTIHTSSQQSPRKVDTSASDKNVQPVDMKDLYRKYISNKKKVRNSTFGKAHFVFLPAIGYSIQTEFAMAVAESGTFYPFKNPLPEDQPSTLLTSLTYSQYNQFILPVQTNIWTRKTLYNIILDWRFMKYPSTTFGLGGKTKLDNGYTIDFNYIKLHESVMRKVARNFYAGLGLYYDAFGNVQEIGVDSGRTTSFEKYGFHKNVVAVGPAFRLLYDSRNNPANASKGFYANVTFRPNRTWIGSDNNWNSLVAEYRGYFHLTPAAKNVLAIWSYNWLTLGKGKPPYLLLPSTGWDDFFNTGRGYVQGRFRGKDMVYTEAEYRFAVSRNGLFGGVVFANTQSFSSKIIEELHLITPGFGAGIRVKLNKYTDTNLCVDYGIGVDGSKGISVNLGEVF